MGESERPRATVYVDGFNLYYGLRDSCKSHGIAFRWLDLNRLCKQVLPEFEVERIKYFTARVNPPTFAKARRQRRYLRALRTLPNLEIYYGHYVVDEVELRLAADPTKKERVLKTEEKGSDVNLATHLVVDGLIEHSYEVAVVVSNDSDLVYPMKVVRREGIDLCVLNSHLDKPSTQIAGVANWVRPVRPRAARAALFPDTLTDSSGEFNKPSAW